MPIQLTKAECDVVKTIFHKHIPSMPFYLFGSRVKGTAKPYSDLDVVIIPESPLPLSLLALIEEDFSESDLPFKVDVIDWQRISTEFQDLIRREWKKLN